MHIIYGELFKQYDADVICITTNGFRKSNGDCVMGKGCAKQAANMIPGLPAILGKAIGTNGNITQKVYESDDGVALVVFPVKPVFEICTTYCDNVVRHMQNKFTTGQRIPGWACVADINIINESAVQLVKLADTNGWKHIVLPRPGCGAGELTWHIVSKILAQTLDDRFHVISFS